MKKIFIHIVRLSRRKALQLLFSTSILLYSALVMYIVSCQTNQKTGEKNKAAEDPLTASGNVCGFCASPEIAPVLQTDVCLPGQQTVDCFAWQTFIVLNWMADPNAPGQPDTTVTAAQFGQPGNFNPVVWESYKDVSEVFQTKAPAPWGKNHTPLLHTSRLQKSKNTSIKELFTISKFATMPDTIRELFQASAVWLTDQDSNLVWYELRMNEDEFNYIYQNQLYDPVVQYKTASQGNGVWLPAGNSVYGNQGAIEIKSAWRVVPEGMLSTYQNRFKISQAYVPSKVDTTGGEPTFSDFKLQYVALVGLHILRKTPSMPQLVWATFEHIDNAPVEGKVNPDQNYSFYNKNCSACPVNQEPVEGKTPLTTPVQVARPASNPGNPADNYVDSLNAFVQNAIRAANPSSVWQYYKLISVQWPASGIPDNLQKGKQLPLATGGITPQVLGNTTLETYFLTNTGCMSCHQYAGISTKAQPSSDTSNWPSDYSFLFKMAQLQKK